MNDRGSAPANEVDERQVETPSANWLANKKVWIAALSAVLILVLILGLILIPRGADDQEAKRDSNSVEEDATLDSDEDGISDAIEKSGWRTATGATYVTDPKLADTDGDGLSDSEEAGAEVSEGVYKGVANPLKTDSDDDGLDDKTELIGGMTLDDRAFTLDPLKADTDGDQLLDIDEVDNGTHPNFADTDGDGLGDFYEINIIGTDALSVDTDNDNFNDAFEDVNRESKDLDPQFEKVEYTEQGFATDFAQGVIFGPVKVGTIKEKDTLPFLLGNLMVGLLGYVPVVGQYIWIFVTVRDILDTMYEEESFTPGAKLIAVFFKIGDRKRQAQKITNFLKRFPYLAPEMASFISNAPHISYESKKYFLRAIWNVSWIDLIDEGSNESTLFTLGKDGKIDLNFIRAIIEKRAGHKKGEAVEFMRDGYLAKEWLQNDIKGEECGEVCTSNSRYFDVFADGIGHEAKLGYVSLTESVKRQAQTDAYLMKTGQIDGAQWHFFPSEIAQSGRLGPSESLLDLLDQHGIKYTIHLPK